MLIGPRRRDLDASIRIKVVDVTVLGLVGGALAPGGGETPRVADSSAAGAGRFFHNSVPPSKQNRLGNILITSRPEVAV